MPGSWALDSVLPLGDLRPKKFHYERSFSNLTRVPVLDNHVNIQMLSEPAALPKGVAVLRPHSATTQERWAPSPAGERGRCTAWNLKNVREVE